MFVHNLHLAWLSLKKSPILSTLMIAAIGVGIAVCMTIITVYKLMADDPLPHKSDKVFTMRLDIRSAGPDDSDDPPNYMSYIDATNLLKSDIPTDMSVHYQTVVVVKTQDNQIRPFRERLRLATNGFFAIFDAPFKYGTPWSDDEEQNLSQVVVLSQTLNDKVFGGQNSVGKQIQLDGRYFKVVGVLDEWAPSPRFFELDNGVFVETNGAFIPFSLTRSLAIRKSGGSTMCHASETAAGWEGFLGDECTWLHTWVQLDSDEQRRQWQEHLDNYALEQKKLGRFPRELNNDVLSVMEWLDEQEVVSSDYIMLLGLAFMFLSVCLFNTVGLMLSQMLRRRGEISVRRALGGSKITLAYQYLVEALVIGLVGGLLGLVLANISLSGVRQLYRGFEMVTQMNWQLVVITLLLAIVSSLLAAIYPTWRVCQLPPAQYLKTQ